MTRATPSFAPFWRVLPAAVFGIGPAAHAQLDNGTTVVRLGIPNARALEKSQVSHQVLASFQREMNANKVQSAMHADDWRGILNQTDTLPKACVSGQDLWARSNALLALGQKQELAALYAAIVEDCHRQDIVALVLENSSFQLDAAGRFEILALVEDMELEGGAEAARKALLDAAEDAQLTELIAEGEWRKALTLADATSDRNRLVQIGWALIEQDTQLALTAFDRAIDVPNNMDDAEARYGAALSAYRSGDPSLALKYLPVAAKEPDSYDAKGAALAAIALLEKGEADREKGDWDSAFSIVARVRDYGEDYDEAAASLEARTELAAAQKAFDAGDYVKARNFAKRAIDHPETARASSFRLAWSDLQLGNDYPAAQMFRKLYAEDPDEEAATGLILASTRLGEVDSLGPFAKVAGGPLDGMLRQSEAVSAIARKDFLTAHLAAPDRHPELSGIDKPWVRQSVAWRSASGQRGEGRVEGSTTRTSLGLSRGRHGVEAGVATVSWRSGVAPANALVGTPGQINDDSDLDGAAPFVAYNREGPLRFSATVSTTPFGGEVEARPVGDISLEHRDERVMLKGRVYSAPIDETITSFSGQTDTASGITWGGAVDSGAEAVMRMQVKSSIALTASASASVVGGKNISSNSHYKIEAGASKSLNVNGFDYLATGPFYQFESYHENTNFHTVGHGGYFSPQAFHRAGWSLNAQTEEGRDWIARVDAAVAYENIETDSAAIMPILDPNGPRFAEDSTSGGAFSASAEVAKRLDDNWLVSGGAAVIVSEAYDDVRAGVSLKYTFGERKAALSRDIGAMLFNRDIW